MRLKSRQRYKAILIPLSDLSSHPSQDQKSNIIESILGYYIFVLLAMWSIFLFTFMLFALLSLLSFRFLSTQKYWPICPLAKAFFLKIFFTHFFRFSRFFCLIVLHNLKIKICFSLIYLGNGVELSKLLTIGTTCSRFIGLYWWLFSIYKMREKKMFY